MSRLRFLGMCLVIATGLGTLFPAHAGAADYFRVEQRQGVWWFVNPVGEVVLSLGVDQIAYAPDKIRGTGPAPYFEAVKKLYPDRAAWERATLERLRNWGFDTIGAWSDPELWMRGVPYTVILNIAARAGADWQHGKPVDVFAPRFEEAARDIAHRMCAPRAGDSNLAGYFSDNELRWGPDWRGKETMLEMYLNFPADAPGRGAAQNFLRERYSNDIARLNTAWGVKAADFDHIPAGTATDAYHADAGAFLEQMATRYFKIVAEAIRAADPNHLYLGARFAGKVPDSVIRASRVADVVSVNIYEFDPRDLVHHMHELTGRPVLITEFAFRAEDSGLPNTKGAGPKVPNQQARAKAYTDYVTRLESLPEAVGYHWFKWSDEPKEGRFDGENSNYGLVNIEDRPYQEFVEAVRSANHAAVEAHRHAKPLSE